MQSGRRIAAVDEHARAIPEATASRLLVYLRVLNEYAFGQIVCSRDLALAAGVDAAKLRRDLSFLGNYGVRGVGYDVATLTAEISRALGAHTAHRVALAGVGNLGQALAGYSGFAGHGFSLVALFDADPRLIGTTAAGLTVHDIADAATVLVQQQVTIGIVATPADSAQQVAEVLLAAGVRSILNFAPCHLEVPGDVHLRQVDLGLELQMLAFHANRRPAGPAHVIAKIRSSS
jgi:redox-sensing transcriptional repressor